MLDAALGPSLVRLWPLGLVTDFNFLPTCPHTHPLTQTAAAGESQAERLHKGLLLRQGQLALLVLCWQRLATLSVKLLSSGAP